jgi:RNA polymerase sigma-70 factor, ECF subfamily
MTAPADDGAELLALYETTIDHVYRYASRLTGGDRARTDDLVQETYLGVLRRLQAGEPLELTAGYLIVACRSRFLDQLKAEHRRTARERRADAGPPPPSEPEARLATEALAALPDDQRAALVLRYVDDLPVADVARHLDRSVRATESLLARGRAALRALLQEGGTP